MSEDKELARQIAEEATNQNIELAADDLVIADGYYISKLLTILAEILNEPGIAEAMVTDESILGDFCMCWWEEDTEEMKRVLAALKVQLGIEVKFDDLLINIANKLKN